MDNYCYILSGSTTAQGAVVNYPSRVFTHESQIADFYYYSNMTREQVQNVYVLTVSVPKCAIVKDGSQLALVRNSGAVVQDVVEYPLVLRRLKFDQFCRHRANNRQ